MSARPAWVEETRRNLADGALVWVRMEPAHVLSLLALAESLAEALRRITPLAEVNDWHEGQIVEQATDALARWEQG